MGGKGVIGGVEYMVALVEHESSRHVYVVEPAQRRLCHDQRVVGDHDVGAAGAADGTLDEALVIVGAGRIDAFAAMIGQIGGAIAHEVRKPGGKIAAGHVAVARFQGPANDQSQRHRLLGSRREALDCLLDVEKAKIVLAALAHDDAPRLDHRIGTKPVEFGIDLALQIAGEGADPDRAPVLFGPYTSRGEIAQRLSNSGPGFGQQDVGFALNFAWRERGRDRRGVIALLGTRFRVRSQQFGEAGARLERFDRDVPGRRFGSGFGPFRQTEPEGEAGAVIFLIRSAFRQGSRDRIGPQPSAAPKRVDDRAGSIAGRGRSGRTGELGQEKLRGSGQRLCLGFEPRRHFEPERLGQPTHRRQAELGGMDEDEKLEHVEGGEPLDPDPARQLGGMADKGRRAAAKRGGRFGQGQLAEAAGRANCRRTA